MSSMPFPVEIKLTLTGGVDQALEELDLHDPRSREVWFLEDGTPGLASDLPLLDARVILRLRTDSRRDQSTVKLRPARRSQLTGHWFEPEKKDEFEYRIEGDWAGRRRVLAASCGVDFPAGTFAPLLATGDLSAAFTDHQLKFIAECAGIPLNTTVLDPLGPIASTQWKDQKLGAVEVDCERWTVGEHDFLEISARADDETLAAGKQSLLDDAVHAHNLMVASGQAPKTETVLRYLIKRDER